MCVCACWGRRVCVEMPIRITARDVSREPRDAYLSQVSELIKNGSNFIPNLPPPTPSFRGGFDKQDCRRFGPVLGSDATGAHPRSQDKELALSTARLIVLCGSPGSFSNAA